MRDKPTTDSTNKIERMNFSELLQQLAAVHGWKAIISLLLSFIGANLLPVAPFLAVGIFLVISDWVTGITAALYRKDKITSRKLGRTILKIIFYSFAIVLVMIVEKTFFKTTYLVYLVSAYICLIELYSNLENISVITGTDVLTIVKSTIKLKFKQKEKDEGDN